MRNTQVGTQIQHPVQHAIEVLLLQTQIASGARYFLFDHRAVGLQHIGHDNRVQQPVVGVIDSAEAVGNSMNTTQTTLEGNRTHARGDLHLQAGLDVIALLGRARQEVLDQTHAFQRDAFRHRVVDRRTEGFQVVRQRIHTGSGGQLGRQANGQLGIQQHDTRDHFLVEDDPLDVVFVVGDHHRLTHFGTGTRGSRHGDHRQHLAGINRTGARFPQRAILMGNQRNGLGCVDRGTAPEGNDAVVVAGLECSYAIGHVATGRVALDSAEQPDLQAGVTAKLQRSLNHRQGRQARVRDQQRRGHAQLAAGFRQLTDAPCTHAHGGGVMPVHAVRLDLHGISELSGFYGCRRPPLAPACFLLVFGCGQTQDTKCNYVPQHTQICLFRPCLLRQKSTCQSNAQRPC